MTFDILLVTISIWDFDAQLSSNNIHRNIEHVLLVFHLLRAVPI